MIVSITFTLAMLFSLLTLLYLCKAISYAIYRARPNSGLHILICIILASVFYGLTLFQLLNYCKIL